MSQTLCRSCLTEIPAAVDACPACGGGRLVQHPELFSLAFAHVDCDAFYASVEKRDRPELRDKPLLIGGGQRGVVATACYIARRFGPRSAMPMYKALRLCPDAVVLRPDMPKYAAVSRQIREIFESYTPLVEFLSLDEAFLDLSGCQEQFGESAAAILARIQARVREEVGIGISIGLSYNKFLAKMASDLDKPEGFAVIGRAEARAFLAPRRCVTFREWGRPSRGGCSGLATRPSPISRQYRRRAWRSSSARWAGRWRSALAGSIPAV